MKNTITFFCALIISFNAYTQISTNEIPSSFRYKEIGYTGLS